MHITYPLKKLDSKAAQRYQTELPKKMLNATKKKKKEQIQDTLFYVSKIMSPIIFC